MPRWLILTTLLLSGCSAIPAAAVVPNVEPTVQARVALTVAAVAKPQAQVNAVPPSPAPRTDKPVTLAGRGNAQTEPVTLAGGDYKITWVVTSPPDALCIVAGWLKSADSTAVSESLMAMLNVPAGKTNTGETYTYRRAPGRYYLQMSTTSCEWSVTLSPTL